MSRLGKGRLKRLFQNNRKSVRVNKLITDSDENVTLSSQFNTLSGVYRPFRLLKMIDRERLFQTTWDATSREEDVGSFSRVPKSHESRVLTHGRVRKGEKGFVDYVVFSISN